MAMLFSKQACLVRESIFESLLFNSGLKETFLDAKHLLDHLCNHHHNNNHRKKLKTNFLIKNS